MQNTKRLVQLFGCVLVSLAAIAGCNSSGGGGGGASGADNDDADNTNGSGGNQSGGTASHNWRAENPSPAGYTLNEVIFAEGRFLAVGDSGVLGTSVDGTGWDFSEIDADYDLTGVVFNGQQYVAVGNPALWFTGADANRAAVFVSSDGHSWSQSDPGDIDPLHAVAWTGNEFLAMGEAGRMTRSSNGADWSAEDIDPGKTIYSLAWDADLGIGVAGGYQGIYRSTDTQTWTLEKDYSAQSNTTYSVVSDGDRFVAVGSASDYGQFLTSEDGVTWTGDSETFNISQSGWRDIFWTGNDFVVVSRKGRVLVRAPGNWSDGQGEWTTADSGFDGPLYGIAVSGGNDYVAVGARGAVLSANNPDSWTARFEDVAGGVDLSAIAANDSGVNVAVGDAGWIATRDAGGQWTGQQLDAVAGNLRDVTWTGTQFAVTGSSANGGKGIVLTSPDGLTWDDHETTEDVSFNHVAGKDATIVAATGSGDLVTCTVSGCQHQDLGSVLTRNLVWAGDRFVIVGDVGTFYTSGDGVSWDSPASPSADGMKAMARGDGKLVIAQNVSNTGKVFITEDFTNWNEVEVSHPDWANPRWIRYANGQFVASTAGWLWFSDDGSQWTPEPVPHHAWDLVGTGSAYRIVGNEARILISADE